MARNGGGGRHASPIDWRAAYAKFGSQLRSVENAIDQAEAKAQVELTPDAVEIMLIPFLVEFERIGTINDAAITQTVDKVVQRMKLDPDTRDTASKRSAFSAIRAWWSDWCDIPPICGPTKK